MNKNKKVSAVIPTYNGRDLLIKHLPAVVGCLRGGDELIVMDDASTDDTVGWMMKTYRMVVDTTDPEFQVLSGSKKNVHIKLVVNKHNLRFGASVNRGVMLATGELILLLNNDVKPKSTILESLLPYFENRDIFAVGCLEQEQGTNTHIVWGGKNKLWFERGMFIHSRADNYTSGETAWVSGGSGMFDREKWLELGGFNPDYYPAYWEDIDLSFRAQQKGWQTWFEEQAVVEHHHETTNDTVFGQQKINQMSWKNGETFAWKNGNIVQKIQHLLWKPYWWWKRSQSLRIT